jgi:hypothetical protein
LVYPLIRAFQCGCTLIEGAPVPEKADRQTTGIVERIEMNWDHMIATVAPYGALAVAFLIAFGTFAAYFQ